MRADPAESFVFTDTLADDEHDSAMFSWYLDLAAARGADLIAVLLDCALEENARRLIFPGRSEALKLTDTARLQQFRATYKLLRGLAEHTVEIDTTDFSPADGGPNSRAYRWLTTAEILRRCPKISAKPCRAGGVN
ncbi:hypothetical protein ACK9YZ_02640 [Rhizobium sp. ZK1]|uniref:hypothetical protein n=1 Tax=Rhizobium sp. ZK1 TaxID=3389872 RepID=UPI0039F6C399